MPDFTNVTFGEESDVMERDEAQMTEQEIEDRAVNSPAPAPRPILKDEKLLPAIASGDLLSLDYPAHASGIAAARAAGWSDKEIGEELRRDEMLHSLSEMPEQLDRRYGRTDESKNWSSQTLEMFKLKELSKATGLAPERLRDRKLVADKLGLSLSAMLDDEVFRHAGERVRIVDTVAGAAKAAYDRVSLMQRQADLLDKDVELALEGGELNAQEQAQLAEVDKQLAAASNVIYKGWAAKTSAATSDLAVQQLYGLNEGLSVLPAYAAGALAVNGGALAMASALGPLSGGAAVLSALGEATAAAALHGNFVNSMKVEQAGLYRELLQIEGLSRRDAALLARAGGALNGAIEVGNLSTVLSLVPGLGAVGERFASILRSKGGAKALLAVPSVRRTLLAGLKNYASGVTSETMEEIEQAAVSTLFVEVTKRAKGQDGASLEEALSGILDEGREALGQMALGMLPGAVVNTGMTAASTYCAKGAVKGAEKGKGNAQFASFATAEEEARVNAVKELEASRAKAGGVEAKAAAETKTETTETAAEAPVVSAAREDRAAKAETNVASERAGRPSAETGDVAAETAPGADEGGTGDDWLFIGADALDSYMQSLPEPQRETLGQALGLHKISTKEYLLRAKDFEKAAGEHGGLNDAVAMDLRAGALGVTARERTEAMEKIKALGLDPMEGDEPFAVEARAVRDHLAETLVQGGQSKELARANADLMSHHFYSLAYSAALDETGHLKEGASGPKAFYEKLKIRFEEQANKKRPSSPKGEGAVYSTVFSQPMNAGVDLNQEVTGVVVTPTLADGDIPLVKTSGEVRKSFFDKIAGKYLNTDTQWEIFLSKKNIDHAIHTAMDTAKKNVHNLGFAIRFEDIVKILEGLPQIVQNAKLIESHEDRHKNPDVKQIHRMYCPVKLTTDPDVYHVVKLTVKELKSGYEATIAGIYRGYDAKVEQTRKKASDVHRTPQRSDTSNTSGAFSVSIGDMLDQVKDNDGNLYFQSAWHGSPYRFESFDLGSVGTGEGAQVHGWGLYFAQDRRTSEHYKNLFGPEEYARLPRVIALDTEEVQKCRERYAEETPEREGLETIIEVFRNFGGFDDEQSEEAYEATCDDVNSDITHCEREIERLNDDKESATEQLGDTNSSREDVESAQERLSQITEDLSYFERRLDVARAEKEFVEKLFFSPSDDKYISTLYEVDVPENDVLLDEDKLLPEQPEKVREAISKYYRSRPDDYIVDDTDSLPEQNGGLFLKEVIRQLAREGDPEPKKAASLLLNSLGIKGITYLGERDGRCFVVFDDKAVSVIERYNQEVTGQPLVRQGLTRKPDSAQAKVVRLPEKAVPQFPKIQDFNKWVKALLMNDGNPPVKILSTGQEATFTGRNIRSSLKRARSEAHREAYAALRQMISLAEYDRFEPADAKHLHIQGQDVYYSALSMGDRLYSVRLKLDVPPAGDKGDGRAVYKDHRLTEITIAPALYSTEFGGNQSRTQEAGAISTVSLGVLRGNVKPSNLEGGALWQEQLRGSVEFRGDKSLITLFKAADQSTFVHEMGHVMLENLLRLGRGDDAPPMVARDLDVALDFLNMKDFDFDRVETPAQRKRLTDAQERFARAFERYLMEGRAPSKGLKGVFARMKRWMLSVYHNARRLGVELSPQVRDLFARLLAGPATEEGGRLTLSDLHDDAAATKACLAELNAEVSKKRSRVEEAQIAAASLDEKDMPDWVPSSLIDGDLLVKSGQERSALTGAIRKLGGIDYASLKATWSQGEAQALLKRDRSLFRKGGAAFDTLLPELRHLGIVVSDVQELYDRLMAANKAEERGLNVAITDDTLPWLFYLMSDGEVREYAAKRRRELKSEMKALQNADEPGGLRTRGPAVYKEQQLIGEVLAEIEEPQADKKIRSDSDDSSFIGKKIDFSFDFEPKESSLRVERIPTLEAAERAAGLRDDNEMIGLKEADRRAWRRAQRESRKAFFAGKKLGVERQKERVRALKDRQKERALLKKEVDRLVRGITAAGEQKSVIWAARQEIKEVLKGYTLKAPSRQRLARAQELFNYLTDHPEARLEDYSPGDRRYMDMLGTTLLPDMTIDELRGLATQVEDIRARGCEAYRRWEAAKQLRRDEKFNGCFKALGKIPNFDGKTIRGVKDLRKEYKGLKGRLEKVRDWTYADTLGAHRLMDWIGNGQGKFDSAWTKLFIEDVNSAHDEYLRCKGDRHEGIEAVMRDEGIGFHDLSKSRRIDGQVYSIDEMMSVYALMKNEKGKKALLYGNFKGLPDPQGHAAHIIRALTPGQRALADAVLADYDRSFDRLNARFIEVFNEGMEKEENYSPMKRLEYTSNEGLIDAESEETLRGRSVAAGARASLDKGFLVRRMEISEEHQQPVDLGLLSIWNDQVATQEHTAAFAALAGDLNSVLSRRDEATNTSMAMAVRLTKGTEAWNAAVGYTNLVIMNETRAAHNALNKAASTLGRNMSMVYLAGSISAALKQVASIPRFLMTAGPTRLLAACGQYMENPRGFMREVYRLDPQIRERVPNAFYRLTKIDPTKAGELGYSYDTAMRALMTPFSYMDRVAAAIGWRATYDAEISRGRSPKEAYLAAQRAVALTQQVPNMKDMPAFWRQSGLAKLMMIFSSNNVPIWGMTVYDMAQSIKRGDVPKSLSTMLALAVSATAMALVTRGTPSGDDDDSWLEWLRDGLVEQSITAFPVVGKEMMAAYDELINRQYRGSTYSALVTPVVKTYQGVARMTSDDGGRIMGSGLSKFETGAWQAAEGLSLLLGGTPVTMARRIRTALKSDDGWKALRVMLAMRRKERTKRASSW